MKKTFAVLSLLAIQAMAFAGPGHDHGEEAPAPAGEASPRVVMESDFFEAVGILKGHALEIFIDHAATNAPVKNATLELKLNGEKVPLEQHSEGEFDADLPDSMLGKNLTVALRVKAGDQSEVLNGNLVLVEQAHADEEHGHGAGEHAEDDHAAHDDHGHELHGMNHLAMGGLVLLAVLALVLIALFLKRRNKGVK